MKECKLIPLEKSELAYLLDNKRDALLLSNIPDAFQEDLISFITPFFNIKDANGAVIIDKKSLEMWLKYDPGIY